MATNPSDALMWGFVDKAIKAAQKNMTVDTKYEYKEGDLFTTEINSWLHQGYNGDERKKIGVTCVKYAPTR